MDDSSSIKKSRNYISCTFHKLNKDRLPEGWKIEKNGEYRDIVSMSSIQGRRPEDNVVKISILKESSVYLDTTRRAELELGKRYLFVVEFKIDDMHYTGNWYNRPAGVRMYVYGMKDKHSTLFVRGDGSTDGWVSAVMPFTTRIDKDGRDLSRPNVLLRCYNMVGTVSFRKPIIIEVPNGVEASSYFEMDNGRMVHGGVLTLTETQEGDKS